MQAKKGSFSAYAYEVLPLLHTLLGKNTIEAETFSADTVAFLDGYKGHVSPVMQEFLANTKKGFKGDAAASNSGHANSLVKVALTTPAVYTSSHQNTHTPASYVLFLECSSLIARPCSCHSALFTLLHKELQPFKLWPPKLRPQKGHRLISETRELAVCAQVPLVVARYGGDPALMGKVATAVQLHQSDADALLAAHLFATILERFAVFGGTLQVISSPDSTGWLLFALSCDMHPLDMAVAWGPLWKPHQLP